MKELIKILVFSIALSVLLTSCGGGGGGSEEPKPKECTVELVGDSILNGYMLDEPPMDFIKSKYPLVKIIDNASNGQTLNSFIRNYEYTSKSDLIIFELGGNDAFNDEHFNTFESNLNTFILENLNRNRKLVFTSIVRIDGGLLPLWTDEVKYRVSYINNIVIKYSQYYNIENARWDTVNYTVEDTLDGVHRKQEASNHLVSLLFPYIEKYCKF